MVEVEVHIRLLIVAIGSHASPQAELEVAVVVGDRDIVVEDKTVTDLQATPEV